MDTQLQIIGLIAAYFVYEIAKFALNKRKNGSVLTTNEQFMLRTLYNQQQKTIELISEISVQQKDTAHYLGLLTNKLN